MVYSRYRNNILVNYNTFAVITSCPVMFDTLSNNIAKINDYSLDISLTINVGHYQL